MVRFVERKWWYFAFSGLLIIPGLIFLALGGLKPGIEFKGGTLLDARFQSAPAVSDVTAFVHDASGLNHPEGVVQASEGARTEIRTFEMKPDEIAKATAALQQKF